MIPNSLSQQQMPPIIPPAPISSNLPLYKQHSSFQNTIPSQLYCIRQPATLPTSYKSNSLPRRSIQSVFGGGGWTAAPPPQQPFPRATGVMIILSMLPFLFIQIIHHNQHQYLQQQLGVINIYLLHPNNKKAILEGLFLMLILEIIEKHLNSTFGKTKILPQQQQQIMMTTAEGMSPAERADILDRLHVSPLMNRRVPLRMAGPGFDVDQLASNGGLGNSLTGMLSVTIVEGRNLKVPDRIHSKKLYCVLEIDEIHRARTGISTPEQYFRWSERFDIDVVCANDASFFVYAWHPQLRHRFCHKGDIRLMDVLLVDGFCGNRIFSLNLEPRGQLLLKIAFEEMKICFSRINKRPNNNQFGQSLNLLLQREQSEVPIVLQRLITEIERRGLDNSGIYYLCGASERKDHLRAQLEENANEVDIGEQPVPDINLLTCLVKDFLRELSEPLIPCNIYAMLLDAAGVMPPNDSEGNQKLIMRIVDCLPTPNKTTVVFLIEHLRHLLLSEPHNGMTMQRLCSVFGPLIFCTSNPSHQIQGIVSSSTTTDSDKQNTSKYLSSISVDPLSVQQASIALKLLIENWPRISGNTVNENDSLSTAEEIT
uniref:Rho-GAP domain-containing protein n=1 Tax=Meloidogyne incognita TaxID=6306 RepID=A0A914L4Z4_MELIC